MGLRIPVTTYRLQFNREFGFARAGSLVPYLHELGISDIYASPLLAARPGSPHGYDVTDPTRLNPELGNGEDFAELTGTLQQHRMGLLLDIVPNHMFAGSENPWWRDVLLNGPGSVHATYFDIDWNPARPGMAGKVLLPILGEPFGKALETQELVVTLGEDGLRVCYYERRLPLNPGLSVRILACWLEKLAVVYEPDHQVIRELRGLLDTLGGEPGSGPDEKKEMASRGWKGLYQWYNALPEFKSFVDLQLNTLNGSKGDPKSFEQLEEILAEQFYRPAFWRVANQEINYRRFFDVSDLVSMRIEEEHVFEAVHSFIIRLAQGGQVTGLRIDHIDGLHNPEAYLDRLQERLSGAGKQQGFYVVVEKILGKDEELPGTWPVYGTTGYDFLNTVNGLFVEPRGVEILNELYVSISGLAEDFGEVVYRQKRRVLTGLFASELRNLARRLERLAVLDRYGRDITLEELEQGLIEVTTCLKVYRTYISDFKVSDRDRAYIEQALAEAARRSPSTKPACAFLGRVLLLQFLEFMPDRRKGDWLELVMRWQQFTGPVMAKGFEDTTLYIYNRLVSLNEVAGEPGDPGISPAEFHRRNKARRERWPHTVNAGSTHDTKRSEDVRARINVLSEIPTAWSHRIEAWCDWNRARKEIVNGRPVPEGNTELLIYQTLVGAWPLVAEEIPSFKERLRAYLIKAAREAKVHTSWLDPDDNYERALGDFTAAILETSDENSFLRDLMEFQKTTAYYGALNSLAQVLLKVASPGVPDFYQGTELWNLSLVDPDNRRPVDFEARMALLASLKEEESRGQLELAQRLLSSWEDGRIKLYLIYKALNFRKAKEKLFSAGEYIPVAVEGPAKEHLCAFARYSGEEWVLVAVPRLLALLQSTGRDRGLPVRNSLPGKDVWRETALILPEGSPDIWRNIFTGEKITTPAAGGITSQTGKTLLAVDILKHFPVVLLQTQV